MPFSIKSGISTASHGDNCEKKKKTETIWKIHHGRYSRLKSNAWQSTNKNAWQSSLLFAKQSALLNLRENSWNCCNQSLWRYYSIQTKHFLSVKKVEIKINTYAQCHCVCNSKFGHISGPQRLEVIGETNFTAAIHFGRFSVQFRQSNLGRRCRIRDRNL